MLKAVNAKEFDMIATWSVDRLGRSLTNLLGILQGLHDKDVDLFLHRQGLDTSTTAGKAMFQMLGVFAEFERGIIRERINAGLARAKAKGKKLGRRPIERCIEAGRTSSSAIAADLNARGIAAPNGGRWFPMQVRRVRDRLGL